jgi:flagellar basal-body rod protein FlgF
MSRGIYVALSGAMAQENALETTAANVANASSPGYQRLRPIFRQELARAGKVDPSLRYASVGEAGLDTQVGAARATGRALDAMLPQGVYLGVGAPKAERFTRAASLVVGPDGTLKTTSGHAVLSDTGTAVRVDPGAGEVRLSPEGNVLQGTATVAKLRLVRFERPERLAPEGKNVLGVGGAGQVTAAQDKIEVGALEESNAQPVVAMTELVGASRTFEAFQKVLDSMGEADRKLLTSVPGALE